MGHVPADHYKMTLDEVAAELGVSRQAVYDTEQRALRKLRQFHFGQMLKIRAMAIGLRQAREREVGRFERALRRQAC